MDAILHPAAVLSEADARVFLHAHPGDGLEAWIAEQPWQAAEDAAWLVTSERDGWGFRVEAIPGGDLRIVGKAPGTAAATSWVIDAPLPSSAASDSLSGHPGRL